MSEYANLAAICDTETEYAFRLMERMQESRGPFGRVRVFSSAEHLLNYVEKQPVELLMISEHCMCEAVQTAKIHRIVVLEEEGKARFAGCASVRKYQPPANMLREALSAYGPSVRASGKPMQALGVYSPAEYSQRMLTALLAARQLSEQEPVLFLELSVFSGLSVFTGEAPKDTGELLYLTRRTPEKAARVLPEFLCTLGGVKILPPPVTGEDLQQLSGTDWERYLGALQKGSGCRRFVLDIGPEIPDAAALLKLCETIWLPQPDDRIGDLRTEAFEMVIRQRDPPLAQRLQRLRPPEAKISGSGVQALEALSLGAPGAYVRRMLKRPGREE